MQKWIFKITLLQMLRSINQSINQSDVGRQHGGNSVTFLIASRLSHALMTLKEKVIYCVPLIDRLPHAKITQ
jgi:hypothetical protein